MAYITLASSYDGLTRDVDYAAFADLYERLIAGDGRRPSLVLDLACGTGTLTCLFSARGYEMIGVDASPDMLTEAREKADKLPSGTVRPLFLCQRMQELDLYGTVSAAVCSLDGLDYVPPEDLREVFRRLGLFIEPGGVFAFDVNKPEKLRALDGEVFLDETDDAYCVWRAEWDEGLAACRYGLDLFTREGELWERGFEEHIEYAHTPETLTAALREAGFSDIRLLDGADTETRDAGRLFMTAKNTKGTT